MGEYGTKDKITAGILWCLFAVMMVTIFLKWEPYSIVSAALPWQGFFFIGIAFFMLFYILFIAICATFYKPAPDLTDEVLPYCTVIVPAYNEGRHVSETLESLLNCNYPAEKMEIIAINDGSKDDTMQWINHAAAGSGSRIIPVDLKKNSGKKHALYHGIIMAKHDIIVTIDSDSIVTSRSIRTLISGFNAPDVGAVAGNIRIKNLRDGIIPKMMDVGFMFGFEIIRSAQSLIGYVLCTPGALSAYRKSMLLPFLDKWLNQKFLGVPVGIGEDRSIASMLLQSGKRIVYQRDAIVWTCVPNTYIKFCKMMLRWMRSDVRENFIMAWFGFRNITSCNLRYAGFIIHAISLIISTLLPLSVFGMLFIMCINFTFTQIINTLCYSIEVGLIGALIPAMIYAKRVSPLNSVWALVYSIYSMFLLLWIPVYAFFTVRNSKWLTREIVSDKKKCVFNFRKHQSN